MMASMDVIPLLEGIVVHPLFLSPDLPLAVSVCASYFFTKVCPTRAFVLVTVVHRLVSGRCFIMVVLAPLFGRLMLPSVCGPFTLRMLCRQGCSGRCLVAVVAVLSGECFATVVVGSLTSLGGCFATVAWSTP